MGEQAVDSGSATAGVVAQGALALPAAATALDAQIAEGLADLSNIDSIRDSERQKPYIGDRESLEALKTGACVALGSTWRSKSSHAASQAKP